LTKSTGEEKEEEKDNVDYSHQPSPFGANFSYEYHK
jgi:hypothetical protein